MKYGRKKPYTALGIKRLPCCRCGEPAQFQWSICADGNLKRPICMECDIKLNKLVLTWIGDPGVKRKIEAYSQSKRQGQ